MTAETVFLRGIEATAGDQDFLEEMTYEAAIAGLRTAPTFREVMGDGQFAECFADWGKPGDEGFIAFDGEDEELGAAWRRVRPDKYVALGEGRSYTPEVVMALRGDARGRGVGTLLLGALMDQARDQGIARLRLNVVTNNTPAIRLYTGLGFAVTGEAPTVVATEAAWSLRMAAWLTDRGRTPGGQWYTETDYERPELPLETGTV